MAHILLLEPDRILAEIYGRALSSEGHQVVPCASAQAAVLAADQQRPDVVLLELQLIEHSGIEFLYEFRSYAEWQSIPVIIHTHVPPSEFATQWQVLKQLGIGAYLYKSHASLKQLSRTVDEQLSALYI